MRPLNLQHQLPCSFATFWKSFWDPDFDAMLQTQAQYKREILQDRTENGVRTWVARVTSGTPLPPIVAKLTGTDRLVYDQHNRLDIARGHLDWQVKPQILADKIKAQGSLDVRDLGGNRCERLVKGEITVSVPLIGGTVEAAIVENIGKSYENTAIILRDWLKTHAPA